MIEDKMSNLMKHFDEENLYLNNHHDNSSSDSSSDEEGSHDDNNNVLPKSNKQLKKSCFIYNDLKKGRAGGLCNNDKKCKCCGKPFTSKYYYLPLNFECGESEDHPTMSLACAMGAVCCIHHWSKKNDDLTEEELRDE